MISGAIGLRVHPPTVWAAAGEGGLPAAVIGAMLGLVIGLLVRTSRGVHRD